MISWRSGGGIIFSNSWMRSGCEFWKNCEHNDTNCSLVNELSELSSGLQVTLFLLAALLLAPLAPPDDDFLDFDLPLPPAVVVVVVVVVVPLVGLLDNGLPPFPFPPCESSNNGLVPAPPAFELLLPPLAVVPLFVPLLLLLLPRPDNVCS